MTRYRLLSLSRPVITAVLGVVLLPLASQAGQIRVPADVATIRDAVNQAASGETVLVSAGTYSENNINFGGKNVVVMSESGRDVTIIDGGSEENTIFQFVGGESRAAEVNGFTIRNGRPNPSSSSQGGCVQIVNSSPSLLNNRFTNCRSNPTITISNGSASNSSSGGAIKIARSESAVPDPLIQGNVFDNNRSYTQGGAIHIFQGAATILNNEFRDNLAQADPAQAAAAAGQVPGYDDSAGGGAVSVSSGAGTVTISGNLFEDNEGFNQGGAVSASVSELTVTNNTFLRNTAGFAGGGMNAFDSTVVVTDNLFQENGNGRNGGGLQLEMPLNATTGKTWQIERNTFMANTVVDRTDTFLRDDFQEVNGAGAQIDFAQSNATMVMADNVFSANVGSDSRCAADADLCARGGAAAILRSSILQPITSNRFENNQSQYNGGLLLDRVSVTFMNNVVSGNTADRYPGVECRIADCIIDSNRFENNGFITTADEAVPNSGGLYLTQNTDVEVHNNIFANNEGNLAGGLFLDLNGTGLVGNVRFNTFNGNTTGASSGATLRIRGEAAVLGNIFIGDVRAIRNDNLNSGSTGARFEQNNLTGFTSAAALLVVDGSGSNVPTVADLNANPFGADNTGLTPGLDGESKITAGSALVDLLACTNAPADDIDGDSRPQGPGCEPGADEFDLVAADRILASGFEAGETPPN